MPGRRRTAGRGGLGRAALAAGLPLLLAGVLLVRPTTAVTSWPGPAAAAVPVAGLPGSGAEEPVVLRRGGTPTIRLGEAVTDLARQGWLVTSGAEGACDELARSGTAGVQVRGWARDGRVVAVRVEAPGTPGVLLPTAVRTGWSLEAVLAGSDGLLTATAAPGPHDEPDTVLTGRLPVDTWPPEPAPPPAPAGGRAVAAEPPPPAVDLLLGDHGTGRVVAAEVRVPAGRGCTAGPLAG